MTNPRPKYAHSPPLPGKPDRSEDGDPAYVKKMRPCNLCGKMFMSEWIGNHRCKRCKRLQDCS